MCQGLLWVLLLITHLISIKALQKGHSWEPNFIHLKKQAIHRLSKWSHCLHVIKIWFLLKIRHQSLCSQGLYDAAHLEVLRMAARFLGEETQAVVTLWKEICLDRKVRILWTYSISVSCSSGSVYQAHGYWNLKLWIKVRDAVGDVDGSVDIQVKIKSDFRVRRKSMSRKLGRVCWKTPTFKEQVKEEKAIKINKKGGSETEIKKVEERVETWRREIL